MQEYVSPNPNAEVTGQFIKGYLNAFGDDVLPYADKRGYGNLDLNAWYNYQSFLDLLSELATPDMQGTFDLIKIGMRTGSDGVQRYQPTSIEDFFVKVKRYFADTIRGLDTSTWWDAEIASNQMAVYSSSYTGCDYSYGVLYAVVRDLRPANNLFSVIHRAEPCRKRGDNYCIYDVRWWEESHYSGL